MEDYNSRLPEFTIKYKTGNILKQQITNSETAAEYFMKLFDADTLEYNESVIVIYMDRGNKTIGWQKHSQGGISASLIDVRMILSTALTSGASAFMIAHNHPSGSTKSSRPDDQITSKLLEAGKTVDIKLLDHIIVTADNGYYSYADEGKV